MDRFRVRSLDRLLRTATLTDEQRRAATQTLLDKLDVLLGGAHKRGNRELLEQLRPLHERYRNRAPGGCAA